MELNKSTSYFATQSRERSNMCDGKYALTLVDKIKAKDCITTPDMGCFSATAKVSDAWFWWNSTRIQTSCNRRSAKLINYPMIHTWTWNHIFGCSVSLQTDTRTGTFLFTACSMHGCSGLTSRINLSPPWTNSWVEPRQNHAVIRGKYEGTEMENV